MDKNGIFWEIYEYSLNKTLIFDMGVIKVVKIQITQMYLSCSRWS